MTQHADDDILLEEAFQVIMTYWKKCGGISNCLARFNPTDPVKSELKHAAASERQVQ